MNKEQKMWITVTISTIVVLILLFAGITYAFFTTNDNVGSTAEIINTSGKMTITYADGGSKLLISSNISPSNNIIADKTFTLTGLNTTTAGDGLSMPYRVGLKYNNEFSDGQIHYYIKKISSSSEGVTTVYTGTEGQTIIGNETETGYSHGTLKLGNRYTELVTGVYPASKNSETITFNLKLQFPDNGQNQDTEKGKSLNVEVVVNYEPKATTFAADTWETIAAVVQYQSSIKGATTIASSTKDKLVSPSFADLTSSSNNIVQTSTVIEAYPVGSEKEIEIDGKSYTVRVANNTISDECNKEGFSETACGFVVEFVDVVEDRMMNSSNTNKGGWPASELRTYANGDFFNKLPEELRDVIIDTKVISSHGSSDTSNFVSTDKIYLLSGHEVWRDEDDSSQIANNDNNDYKYLSNEITNDYIAIPEPSGGSNKIYEDDSTYYNTRQLDYYANDKVTIDSYSGAMKEYSGQRTYWWLRSAVSSSANSFINVYPTGLYVSQSGNSALGFAPAFRIG